MPALAAAAQNTASSRRQCSARAAAEPTCEQACNLVLGRRGIGALELLILAGRDAAGASAGAIDKYRQPAQHEFGIDPRRQRDKSGQSRRTAATEYKCRC